MNNTEPEVHTMESECPFVLSTNYPEQDKSMHSNTASVDLVRENEQLRIANRRQREENHAFTTKSEERALKIKNMQYHARQTDRKISQAVANVTIDDLLASHDPPLHPTAETMVRLQFHKPNTPYTPEEQDLAKQFQYHSASAFARMRKAGLVLPGETTVRSWVAEYDITPGFCPVIFEKLKEKMALLSPLKRKCSIAIDEMGIKAWEEYSIKFDGIEGLVDLGPLGRRDQRAHIVFIFSLTSLNCKDKWRQAVAYFYTLKGGISASEINVLLKECLHRLKESNVQVQLIVCDQGPSNQKLYSEILQVNIDKASIVINEESYFVSFDFPHLIKRIVTALRNHGGIWKDETKIVCWNDFVQSYEFDKTLGTSNLLSHISDIHMAPNNFQSMNVKRAFQIFRARYAQAIRLWGYSMKTAAGHNFASSTWEATAQFVEKMNNIIDACNSMGMIDRNPNRRPFSPDNPQIEELIRDMIQWSKTWRIPQKRGFTILPSFYGLQLAGNALLGVYNSVSQEYPNFKFATARGNQDGTEHWFGLLRAQNGNCQNPPARMVRLSTRHVLAMNDVNIGEKGNVSCEVSTNHSREMNDEDKDDNREGISEVAEIIFTLEHNRDGNDTAEEPMSFYKMNAVAFFAGYIAFKTVGKCQACKVDMTKSPMDARCESELYIEFREYENVDEDAPPVTKLTRPTDRFTKIVQLQLRAFDNIWKKHWASTSVLKSIAGDIIKSLQLTAPDWFNQNHPCCIV
ncbi:uncharacterized protein LOC135160339 isoform X2 [Diachasmimorpha longicaudata]|uniref:uncharacterized protein LOC135160339 isoform X2 n=1 Tax=Diachasmimorpha longicaudata TaxID=58733 RepID=UPI0030B9089F